MNRQEIKILAAMGIMTLMGCRGTPLSPVTSESGKPKVPLNSNSECGQDWPKILEPFTKPYTEEDFSEGLILAVGVGNKRLLTSSSTTEAIDVKSGRRVMFWRNEGGSSSNHIEEIYDGNGRKIAERKVVSKKVDTIWIADYNGVGDYRRFTEYALRDGDQCIKLNGDWSPANIIIDGQPAWREDQPYKPGKEYEPYSPQPFPTPSFNQRLARDFISPRAKIASKSSIRRKALLIRRF